MKHAPVHARNNLMEDYVKNGLWSEESSEYVTKSEAMARPKVIAMKSKEQRGHCRLDQTLKAGKRHRTLWVIENEWRTGGRRGRALTGQNLRDKPFIEAGNRKERLNEMRTRKNWPHLVN